MRPRVLTLTWTATLLVLLTATVIRWRRPEPTPAQRLTIPATAQAVTLSSRLASDSTATAFEGRDPFRIANQPARARYSSVSNEQTITAPAVVHEARPTMTLRAIAGGPPWQALIDGMPGQTHAALVRAGMVVDRVTIRSITRDTVVVRGIDTTWVLTFARRQ